MDRLLELIEQNGRLSIEELAAMLSSTPQAVAEKLDEYTQNGILKGYRAIINYDKINDGRVQALIELKVTPKKDVGFDEIARTVAAMSEVDGVQLISGGYDLLVTISGRSFHEIANFVARRLSPLSAVLSTATHFVLSTYKKDGIMYAEQESDGRGMYL